MKNLNLLFILNLFFATITISFSCDYPHGHSNGTFIAPAYESQRPLAQIVNPTNYFEDVQQFELFEETLIHIYGVGEISFDLPDNEKRYYLENDGFDLYFQNPLQKRAVVKKIWINHGTKAFGANKRIKCKWTKFKNYKYIAQLSIPLVELNFLMKGKRDSIKFNIADADNDDGLIQKAKLSWMGAGEDVLQKELGWLVLQRSHIEVDREKNVSQKNIIDTIPDSRWKSVRNNLIKNLAYGFVKDKFDLPGSFKYLFDGKRLYLRVEVLDSPQKTI